MGERIGTVDALWRYPVKSMQGESCDQVVLNERGAEGDRLYAVRDHNGKFGSGKTTRRFTKMDGLFRFRSFYEDGKLGIEFPDGTKRIGLSPKTDLALSQLLGQPVRLAAEAAVSHFDAAPVHLLTQAALSSLRRALPDMRIDERRFRPNLLLNVIGNEPLEHSWIGRQLRIGTEVVLEITELTERCVMTTFAQSELPYEPKLLRHLAEVYDANFGVYAKVVQGGIAALHDTVELI
ncbi:MOSC domain-containing protein [Paenibacillus thalictri]|uniref:MOSC domain-containing protein n=1 Tax=Paenibacillus thalictri TaxID=2527873 RepID=A0A4Q9DPB5_9BACL|nr:MOSC N-terminal beta barrel domain-containing protein [Paenibacillus thalictri]TBL75068.1 MOSC domain-containing protein [Paenibacillus thalictri]